MSEKKSAAEAFSTAVAIVLVGLVGVLIAAGLIWGIVSIVRAI